MRVLRLCVRVPPSLALRLPTEEGTTDLDDEEGQQHLRVKHDERSAHSSLLLLLLLLLLLSAWKEGVGPFATSERATTHCRRLIFGAVQATSLFCRRIKKLLRLQCVCEKCGISPRLLKYLLSLFQYTVKIMQINS